VPVRPLPAIPSGTPILIDANIFIYTASAQSAECETLLERCAKEEVIGVTTFEVLSEVCHRRMVAEAFEDGLITRESASALRRKRDALARLRRYQAFIDEILTISVLPLELDEARFKRSSVLRSRYGLLTNDSLILAAADLYGIEALATLDEDFDAVPWLTIYKPDDLR